MAVVDGARIHFVDHGEGRPVLLVHGNPTWSFLWRKVIARLPDDRVRVIAPDLIGLGLSDKPHSPAEHTLDMHVSVIAKLVESLNLQEMTISGQDWGGPVAAGVAARAPGRVRAAVFANTAILEPKKPLRTTPFHMISHVPVLSDLLFRGLNFPVPILNRAQGDRSSIGPIEKRAYAWPLGSWRDRAAPLGMARMVPNRNNHPSICVLEDTDRWARWFKGPTALVWGLRDPILGRALHRLREAMPHAKVVETQGGHFIQEEASKEIADAILEVTGE